MNWASSPLLVVKICVCVTIPSNNFHHHVSNSKTSLIPWRVTITNHPPTLTEGHQGKIPYCSSPNPRGKNGKEAVLQKLQRKEEEQKGTRSPICLLLLLHQKVELSVAESILCVIPYCFGVNGGLSF